MVASSIFLVTFIKIGFVSSRHVESLPDAMVSTNNQKNDYKTQDFADKQIDKESKSS